MTTQHPPFIPKCPRAVICLTNASLKDRLTIALRELNWEVVHATRGDEVRRRAREAEDVVILSTAPTDETGWLICDKLTREMPWTRVFLVADQIEQSDEDFSLFVGATALFSEEEEFASLVDQVCGMRPIVVGN